jgi:hypothetical protein
MGRLSGWASGLPVVHLDRQLPLLEKAMDLDQEAGVSSSILPLDALEPAAWETLGPGVGALGLHACGALGDTLLEEGAKRGAAWLVVATCCYHKSRFAGGRYLPLSATGRNCELHLTSPEVRLSIYDEVVARPRTRRSRRRQMAYRAGLDLLHREATGEDHYVPIGPLPNHLFQLPFDEFCAAVNGHTGLEIPRRFDPGRALTAGEQWARRARALGLVRGLFRRPLEVWLLLDRVRRQEELGRRVAWGSFCPRAVTPRNLAIISTPTAE